MKDEQTSAAFGARVRSFLETRYTAILVAHTGQKFQKLRFSRMAVLIVVCSATIVTVLFGLSALQNYRFYALYGALLVPADVDPGAIRSRLDESSKQIDQALGDARKAVVSLQDAVEEQRRELEEVRSRYDSLKALANGRRKLCGRPPSHIGGRWSPTTSSGHRSLAISRDRREPGRKRNLEDLAPP